LNQAYLGLIEAGERIDTSEAILASAEEGYRMAEVGFKEGVTTSIDLLDAEHGLTQAKLNRAKANFDYETQKARLARSCGLESLAEQK
jgi:outer membrane protein